MFERAAIYLREQLRRRTERIPVGISWASVVVTDAALIVGGVLATWQRPAADLTASLIGFGIGIAPLFFFFFFNMKFRPAMIWLSWSAATAVYLFGTSTPVASDIAPSLVVVMVLVVTTLTSAAIGCLAAVSAATLLLVAATMHRLDVVGLYLLFVVGGWVLGYLMNVQRQLLAKQIQAQEALALHAAADERRRIAREVHDVIAHSLSITLLNLTGARRALQQDRGSEELDDAIEALEQAERLGRQAMADIRRTVGLLDSGPSTTPHTAPEPGIDDISTLVADFERAGLAVTLQMEGNTRTVSAAVGLALYRITQESLANIAKHAPGSKSEVKLDISPGSARLTVNNQLPAVVVAAFSTRPSEGRGLRGMRQRVELLGGAIEVGPTQHGWSMNTEIPLEERPAGWRPWWCPSHG